MIERVGIAGVFGSGKTTAAKYLMDNHGFTLLGFATPLYTLGEIHVTPQEEWHSRLFGWTWDYLKPLRFTTNERWTFINNAMDVMEEVPVIKGKNRTLLQLLGTEVGRKLDENLWINIFENRVEELGEGAKIVNDNLRFPNEFDCLERLDFTTVFFDLDIDIARERYELTYGVPFSEQQIAHASESYLEETRAKCDYVFDNGNGLDKLHEFLDELVKERVPV